MRRPLSSIAEAQRLAKQRLPAPVYWEIMSGVEKGMTRDGNSQAFDQIGLIPRLADLGDDRKQSTQVLGQDIAFPVLTSSVAAVAIHSGGEAAVARATKAAGTAMALSNFAVMPMERVAPEAGIFFFQLYWIGSRDDIQARVERARRAGAKALIVTLDYAITHRRDENYGALPDRESLASRLRFVWPAVTHPRWLFDFLLHGGLPAITAPNTVREGEPAPSVAKSFEMFMSTKLPTWEDIRWLREIWGGPFMVKGVMHPDDARRAVDVGATAISVSNHGGNNIDSTPAAIRALPAVAEAVGSQIEILLDGGIRRGSDVVKALALGARAVLIGRAHLFGLAAGGERGVFEVLQILRTGIHETLHALGRTSIHDLVPTDLLLPDNFAIRQFPQSSVITKF